MNFNLFNFKPFVFVKWSNILPGVPIIICGFFCNFIACIFLSTPPIIVIVFKPIFLPNSSHVFCICNANSRVGANTNTWQSDFFGSNISNAAIKNVPVLPVPDCAWAIVSCSILYIIVFIVFYFVIFRIILQS